MSKAPSLETKVKTLQREVKRLTVELGSVRASAAEYRSRTNRAEGEVSEWKKRFDLLLKREPPTATGSPMTIKLSADDLHALAPNR